MAQLRSVGITITLGDRVSEFDFGMSERVVTNSLQLHPRVETYDFMVPIAGSGIRYKFDTSLVRWDTDTITFDYE